MEKWLADIIPVADVEHDAIVSKQGDLSLVFRAKLPEVFSLSVEEYENIHQGVVRALKALPAGTMVHKQDWITKKQYAPKGVEDLPFLSASGERFFEGRNYVEHHCWMVLTQPATERKVATSLMNNLVRSSIVAEQTVRPELFHAFENVGSQFVRLMQEAGIVLTRMNNADLLSDAHRVGLLEQYCTLGVSVDRAVIKDIILKDQLRVGQQQVQVFTLSDAQLLPGSCSASVVYDRYSTDKTDFPMSFAAPCGLLLACDHIYNQLIVIKDALRTRQQLEKKSLRLRSLAAYSRENTLAHTAVNDYLNECVSEGRIPAAVHCNIMTMATSDTEAREQVNMVTAALAQMEVVAKIESVGAPQIFWSCMPGNEANFPSNDFFDTFIEQASCFLNWESNTLSSTPDKGIRFGERLRGKPVYVDLFHAPMRQGLITNRNMFCCGASGGGKSVTINHILRTLYDQGAHILMVDIGGSYKGLSALVNGVYFTYEESNPIAFNPFYIAEGEVLDTEKKESLKTLLVSLWKQENESFNRSEYVALSNALQGYYQLLASDASLFPCFNSFYEYLESHYKIILLDQRVKERDFDIDNFLYVLRPYYKGGEFDYLLNASQNLDLLHQRFIVFELDNIKDHPILFPVVTLVIMELFVSKMRKIPAVLKVLGIEEAWKPITKGAMADFMRYIIKTVRKFYGITCIVTQEIDDLLSSPIIKETIINNSDIKILMDMRKFMHKFDALQTALGMTDKAKTILLSVNKDNEQGRTYRENYIELGGQKMMVLRNELCPEEYYAYTTEATEKAKVQHYAAKYGSYEEGIKMLVKDVKQST
jgi:conjugation system TraG family ATPase